MLPREMDLSSIAAAREVLDRFAVAQRLQHVRQFIWRGGALQLETNESESNVQYALVAEWDAALLEHLALPGLMRRNGAVIEGRWIRARAGYTLRAGIDLAIPSAISIRSDRHSSFVPFLSRPAAEVERALDADFARYIQAFLSTSAPVPQATAAAAARLVHLGL